MLCFQDIRGEGDGPSTFHPAAQHLRSSSADPHDSLLGRGSLVSSAKYPACIGGSGLAAQGYSRAADMGFLSGSVPSRHLLLGNITWAADQQALEQLFACFGPSESIQLLPEKGCAILSYGTTMQAENAKASLAGLRMALLTGGQPLEIHFLHPQPPPAAAATAETAAAQGLCAWPAAAPPNVASDDDGVASSRMSRTSTTSSRPESDDAATTETWRSVRRQGSSTTSTSLDASECSDAAELYNASAAAVAPRGAAAATLWLANLGHSADRYDIEALLSPFGPLDGVGFSPERGVAFAGFLTMEDAVVARAALDGQVAPSLTGDKPLRVDFQNPRGLRSLCASLDPRQGMPATAAPLSTRDVSSAAAAAAAAAAAQQEAAMAAAAAAQLPPTLPLALPMPMPMPPLPAAATVPPSAASDVPSRHLWLGNILQNVDRQAVETTFSRFGPLESTRVFPDKHFAFVNYLSLEHAVAARNTLRGQMVAPLSGARALEIRFQHRRPQQACPPCATQPQQLQQPQQQQQLIQEPQPHPSLTPRPTVLAAAAAARISEPDWTAGRSACSTGGSDSQHSAAAERRSTGGGSAATGAATATSTSNGPAGSGAAYQPAAAAVNGPGPRSGSSSSYDLEPCRHLWLGNVLSSAKQGDMEAVFSRFGTVESVRIFPAKNYAFVNFKAPQSAEAAKMALGGRPVPTLTGTSPLLLRYKRVPADMSHSGRHPWSAVATAADSTAGLLPWLMLLQQQQQRAGMAFPGGAATAAWNAELTACLTANGSGTNPTATALNDLANNILAQAIAANGGPACLMAAAGPQAGLMQALSLRDAAAAAAGPGGPRAGWAGSAAAAAAASAAPQPSSLWPMDGSIRGFLPPSASTAGGGFLDSAICSPRDSETMTTWAAEQALLESLAAAAMMAPPPLMAAATAGAATAADPFADPQGHMGALLSAMLLQSEPHCAAVGHAVAQ